MVTIRTPDQRLRVFVSSTLQELASERLAARRAIETLRLSPILFELGARPHPPRELYQAYLDQSEIFVGIYWERYGWVAPGMDVSGLEDEFLSAGDKPKLIYIKEPVLEREERLTGLLDRMREGAALSYKAFNTADELQGFIEDDLASLLSEHFGRSDAPDVPEPDVRSRLPASVDAFVGRKPELEALVKLLSDETMRFITLTGPGGIGKTRLALEAATRCAEEFENGACFVSLAAVTQPELVAPAILQALDVQGSGVEPIESLIEYLRERKLLLLLDNFEQVTSAGSDVARVFEHCPQVTILVTSREILNLRPEHAFPVPELELPPEGSDVAQLLHYDAVRLFVDRARAIDHNFELGPENAEAVAAICRRLDALPLALELAAARVRLLSPDSMLTRLNEGFQLLAAGSRDAPDRHKTLTAAIEWSVGLLDDDEKTFFTRLGVFRGGWTLDAAEEICDPTKDLDVLELMTSLLEKSLIKHEPLDGEPRFSMLQTVWEYSNGLLEETEDAEVIREGHADFFLRLTEAAHDGLRSSGQVAWIARLEGENDNLRAALRWCLEHDQAGRTADAGWSLWVYWWINAHLGEARRLMDDTLEVGNMSELSHARAAAVKGVMAFWQADYAVSIPLLAQALEKMQAEGDKAGVALCQLPLGFVEAATGDTATAEARYKESIRFFKEVGDEWGVAISLNAYTWMCLGADVDPGEPIFIEAVDRAKRLGTQMDYGMAVRNMGSYKARRGDKDGAKRLLSEALLALLHGAVRGGSSYTLDAIAEIAADEGAAHVATRLFASTDGIREATGSAIVPLFAGRFQRYVSDLRTRLGDEEFEREWVVGRALGKDAAADLALAWTEGEVPDDATIDMRMAER